MTELVKQSKFGDITFGIPVDMELLNSSYGFYEFLGISKDATSEEIKKVYRELSLKFHPDKGGNEEDFKKLGMVAEILLDDGGELGPEHSQRRHYDEVSALSSYFDEFIQYKDERTKKLSEIMLIRMQMEKKYAEKENELSKKYPEFSELIKELKTTKSKKRKEELQKQIQDIAAEAAGLTPEARKEFDEVRKNAEEHFEYKQREFIESFSRQPNIYFSKVLDVLYIGGADRVRFCQDIRDMKLSLVSHEDKKKILELILGGECSIAGFSQVHFKSENSNVFVTDPSLEGIIHVINGDVNVDLQTSSYGGVIRARAPVVKVIEGFSKQGDLYIPERFAKGNWSKKKPVLDIAVRNGSIDLRLRSQEFAYKESYLENMINDYNFKDFYKKDLYNIIDKNKYKF